MSEQQLEESILLPPPDGIDEGVAESEVEFDPEAPYGRLKNGRPRKRPEGQKAVAPAEPDQPESTQPKNN